MMAIGGKQHIFNNKNCNKQSILTFDGIYLNDAYIYLIYSGKFLGANLTVICGK